MSVRSLWPLLITLGACAGSEPAPDAADAATWHADAAPIFARSCDGCHLEGGVGTPVWSSPEEIAAWAPAIAAAVSAGTMPPWGAADGCNDYRDDFSLSAHEIDILQRWADAGAPLGDPAAAAALPDPFEATHLDRVDHSLVMTEPFTPAPSVGTDEYRCFLMDWPYDEKVWVTGYEVTPGSDAVHHVIPFIIGPNDVEAYRELEAAGDGPGYPCFGGPGGDIQTLIDTAWLGAWAPGTGASVTPAGSGIPIRAGSAVVMQVHYNVTTDTADPDQSSLDLKVETERQGWAELSPWTDTRWLFGLGMEIPARTDQVTHVFEYEHGQGEGDYHIYAAGLHMHELGRSASIHVEHPDGSTTCVLEEDSWDFNWQRTYELVEPVHIADGDVVKISCTWDNPTDALVKWGDGTGDEMCLGTTLLAD